MKQPATPLRLFGRLAALVERVNRLAGLGAGLILLGMVGMICREAIGRYFFDAPTDWVVELSGFLLVGIVFMGGGYILQEDAHLRVDIFYTRFTRRNRAIVDLIGYLMALPFLGFLEWQSALLAWRAFGYSERSMIMRWPVYLPELFVPLGVALLLLQMLIQIVRAIGALRERQGG
ncbi:MAG TPA: TRAP transporter small permease [bacterium]|nr:TRAP transporter small permease [bacterium]